MEIRQFEIWIADLNPQIGTEAGKTRPVLIVQTDMLNAIHHPSTIVCPITTRVQEKAEVLRVQLPAGTAGLGQASDVMIDQVRAIDNKRLLKRVGRIPADIAGKVQMNLSIVLDLEWAGK